MVPESLIASSNVKFDVFLASNKNDGSKKSWRNYQRMSHGRKVKRGGNISEFVPVVIVMLSSISISLCVTIGFVVAFQPLSTLPVNQLSLIQHKPDIWRYHSYHVPRALLFIRGQKFTRTIPFRSSTKSLESTEPTGNAIHNEEHKIITEMSVSKNEPVKNSNNPPRMEYQLRKATGTQHESLSFKDQIQKCKNSVNIIDVIESYQLEQFHRTSTHRAMAVCPFHEDHNPSLHIDATKQIYKCFACNAGGDVIHFVQEYSKLPTNAMSNQPELSFVQALQFLQQTFGDGTTMAYVKQTHDSTKTSQESTELSQRKERILLANAYAALYFTNCLSELYAGGARYYLRSVRGLSSSSIKTMMIGYAPDTYYHRFSSSSTGTNRPNSLVNHLLQSGFTSQEILDSGLAVVRKNQLGVATPPTSNTDAFPRINSTEQNTETLVEDSNWQNATLLMDRFRGRIMVPIFDESGTNILGFGGRIIPLPESNEMMLQPFSNFKAAKYLNSPESLVFEKRKILFNQHIATKSIRTKDRSSAITPLIVVEGYMDAVSLWEIGIYNVAATMGTAISMEQLDQASNAAGCRGGKIVFCLDNDDAGRAAMERSCRNGLIEDCIRKNVVSIYVAHLPHQVKDPADFIESRRTSGMTVQEVAADFRNEVVDTAVDWTEWVIQNLISGYDPNAPRSSPGSFSAVFERIADFLATSFTPAERTKVAYEVAGQLSSLLARNRNSSEISLSVRIQLESDLIDLAARLSAAKEVLQRRIDAASIDTSTTISTLPVTVASLSSGLGPNSFDQDSKLSMKAARTQMKVSSRDLTPMLQEQDDGHNYQSSVEASKTLPRSKAPKPRIRANISRNREPNYVSVTTHFSGFQFQHQSDMDWLGLKSSKVRKKSISLC
jgi:DNA primase catalytic core